MRYALERYKQKKRDDLYRIYVTDALRMISENTAHTVAAVSRGSISAAYLPRRYIDIVEPHVQADEEKAAEGVRERIRKKFD